MNDLLLYALLWGSAALVMLGAWFVQRRTANAGIVDVLWAGGIGVSAVALGLLLEGWIPRRALVAGLGVLWSLRLTSHLVRRFRSEPEDGRYAALRAQLGARFQGWMFVFFQVQAAWIALFASAYWPAMASTSVGWRWSDLAGTLVALASLAGERAADRQLAAWRADPANRGRTCREGLWRLSRHPNYFFEWTFWLAFPLIAAPLAHGWVALLTPTLLYVLITRVTGIPPTERRALASRGEDYRAYQRSTNAFFPGPGGPRTP
jgi:steroid 5-alpha reductase family enzyme